MDYTYNFTAGTRAVAEQVNKNFDDAKQAIDSLEVDVSNIETQLTGGFVLPDGSVDFTRLQSYKTYTVSNATNATPIVITAVAHPFLTGDKVFIDGVGGNTAANGTFTVTKIGVDTFSLDSSVGNGAFTTNGMAVIVPVNAGNLINKAYLDNNAGALKTIDLGTITTGVTLVTNTVSLANVKATLAITLPTTLVAGNENTVIFDFTTTTSSQPTISTSGTLKWADKNGGKAPSAYSVISGVRNILTFKTHDGGTTWEAEYATFGGVETTFVQPTLSDNGALGGKSFAVAASSIYGNEAQYQPYKASDGTTSTKWITGVDPPYFYIWYNPIPLKVSGISITNSNDSGIYNYTIYGSNDNSNWTTLTSGSSSAGTYVNWQIGIIADNRGYYKYHKLYATGSDFGYGGFAEATLQAVYIAT